MKSHSFKLPEIPASEQTPLVQWLLQIILEQQRRIEQLEEEVHKLKGETVKPKIEPSRMDKETASQEEREEKGRSKPGPKRKKTQELTIHRTEIVEVEEVPVGSTFKGYEDYVVQDLLIQPHNPSVIAWNSGKPLRGSMSRLLLEQLWDWGIAISAGQLSQLLTEGQEDFHREKEELLSAGIEVSRYLQVDDTGARHQGKKGYCTYMGNELFAWFKSTPSKSRVNFLELLRADQRDYVINAGALEWLWSICSVRVYPKPRSPR